MMPSIIKGSSTGFIPSHVKTKKIIMIGQNRIKEAFCVLLFWIFCDFRARGRRTKIDITSAITPPSLFGIDRKIA